MERSFVGDPILWPGLIYSPLNVEGVIFAMGSVAGSCGLIFEEFLDSGNVAVCRRKSTSGWERIKAAFAVRSSEFKGQHDGIGLLICWVDDARLAAGPPVLELASFSQGQRPSSPTVAESYSAGETVDVRQEFEDAVLELDRRINKLKNS